MTQSRKRAIRAAFRKAVFERAGYCCECGGVAGRDRQSEPSAEKVELDVHHITNRNELPNGGYVEENGISVCGECHSKAEEAWATGTAVEGFAPADLYELIGSSLEEAFEASELLGRQG